MGAGASKEQIRRAFRRLAKKYPGVNFRYIQASNGEGFIMPDTDQDKRQKEAIDKAQGS